MLNLDHVEDFRSELKPGEQVLWTGQPSRRVVFHAGDLFAVPFSLLWAGLPLLSAIAAFQRGSDGGLLTLFTAAPFLLIGQWLVWGRFVEASWRKAHTFYAITDQRVLILVDVILAGGRSVISVALNRAGIVTRQVRGDGIGTIYFGPARDPDRRRVWLSTQYLLQPAFVDVAGAESAFRVALEAQAKFDRTLGA